MVPIEVQNLEFLIVLKILKSLKWKVPTQQKPEGFVKIDVQKVDQRLQKSADSQQAF